ncbi:unnamed protein product [Phytophthora fragariaefolia]|uniref:Unnamed protein product n=1 Tax=Phytophthora fragariaefolia TaxID=1490495 RepID=A0A9W6XVI5_9STRA|nr:unnamed protein product [Phytophthora fragariaefolia]
MTTSMSLRNRGLLRHIGRQKKIATLVHSTTYEVSRAAITNDRFKVATNSASLGPGGPDMLAQQEAVAALTVYL